MSTTVEKLLDQAESEIRQRGYHAVSFRDLAASLGIKSASVHYYFRQKEDLGIALVKRYGEQFFSILDEKAEELDNPLQAVIDVYRNALTSSDRICLCGMLGAEGCGIPKTLSDEVAAFFQANIDWIAETLPKTVSVAERKRRAEHSVATLQGAMMLATSLNDHKVFDRAANSLLE